MPGAAHSIKQTRRGKPRPWRRLTRREKSAYGPCDVPRFDVHQDCDDTQRGDRVSYPPDKTALARSLPHQRVHEQSAKSIDVIPFILFGFRRKLGHKYFPVRDSRRTPLCKPFHGIVEVVFTVPKFDDLPIPSGQGAKGLQIPADNLVYGIAWRIV